MSANLDEGVLERLRHDLGGDEATVRRFAGNFVSHWQDRADRLERALEQPDVEQADVVLLSIRSSSRMLGAVTLEAESALMLRTLARRDLPGCLLALPTLTRIGDQTCLELTELFRTG